MLKPIPRPVHAVADYSYAALFSVAPELIGFADEETAARLSRVVSSGVLLTSLITRYELGLIRVVPFKAHLAADVAVGLLTAGAPFLFGFSRHKRARNFLSDWERSALWRDFLPILKRWTRKSDFFTIENRSQLNLLRQ